MISLRPFALPDWRVYRGWFSDPDTARRLSRPDEVWLTRIATGPANGCWTAHCRDGAPVAVIQAEWDEAGRAVVSIAVDPAKRERGLGARAVLCFLAEVAGRFTVIEARTEPDNLASIALARRCGFLQIGDGSDGDGMLRFELKPARRN